MNKLPDKINLSSDFPEVTYEQWREQVEKDLKGQSFDKKLITRTYEGIDLKPIYNREDIENLPLINSKPGFKHFVRGSNSAGYLINNWAIQQNMHDILPEDFNLSVKDAIEKGQNCVYISPDFEDNFSGLLFETPEDVSAALKGIDLEKYPLFIESGICGILRIAPLIAYLKSIGFNLKNLKGSLGIDPLAFAAVEGTLNKSSKQTFDAMSVSVKWALKNTPEFRGVGISSIPYHNSGASAVQELAFGIATGVEYLNQLIDRGIKPDDAASMFRFSFGISSFFFMEVAKFRAARLLWSKILELYGVTTENTKMIIHAETSLANQTMLDPYVNLLRTTTEAFSALVGGVDSLRTNPFDESFRTPDEFSMRIARNTQTILNVESHISDIIDPAGGSYFVENLTSEVASKAFGIFKQIQGKGGMLKALELDFANEEIEKTTESRLRDLAKRKSVLVGSNMYANINEELPENKKRNIELIKLQRVDILKTLTTKRVEAVLDDKLAKVKLIAAGKNSDESLVEAVIDLISEHPSKKELVEAMSGNIKETTYRIKPLTPFKASGMFEELRLASLEYKKKNGELPKVFIASMGSLKQHKARVDFSRGFLEVAGFDVVYEKGFETAQEAAKSALKHNIKVVVICSTDDTYPELVPALCTELKAKLDKPLIILAGYPKEQIEAHKASGVDEFLFLGADVYSVNKKIQKRIC